MRLFIAINFDNEVKAQINEISNKVKSNSIQGKFVSDEHLHLTVEFLGEVQHKRLDIIKEIMNQLDFETFTLCLTKIDYFKRPEGNIYWLGIEYNDILFNINKKLHQSLINKGFQLEDRAYKPHITIGRKVKLNDNFNTIELDEFLRKIKIGVNNIDLMQSEFINGKLKYSVLYSKVLR